MKKLKLLFSLTIEDLAVTEDDFTAKCGSESSVTTESLYVNVQ